MWLVSGEENLVFMVEQVFLLCRGLANTPCTLEGREGTGQTAEKKVYIYKVYLSCLKISSLAFQGGQTRCLQRRGTRGAGLGNCRGRARVDSAFLPGLPEGGDAFSLIRFVSGRKRAATVGNGVSVPWNRGWVRELPWTRTGVWWG